MATEDEKLKLEQTNTNSISNSGEADDDHRLGPAPTDEELQTLRKVTDKLSWATWLVAVVELCERFTYYGISGPFQNYMQWPLHGGGHIAGGLGLGQQAATALSYFFQFWCYVTPLLGAVVADKYVGKYKAICIFSGIYVCGNIILTCTSIPSALENGAGMGGLATAMVVIGIGTGGIKSNVGPMIADQYTNTKAYTKVLKSGEKVIVDPNITIQSIFLIFYFCINCGSMSNIATTFMEKEIGFWAAFLLPTAFFFIGIVALVIGKNRYIKRPPQGSVIPDAFRICFSAARNGFNLEKLKPSVRQQNGQNTIGNWSDLFVDEVRRALYACRVFVFYPVFWVCYGQMQNNFVSQASQLQLHGIPNDVMQSVNPFAILILIPITNKVIYPMLRKVGIKMRPITRITCGFFVAALSMVYAAVLQNAIYKTGPCYENVGSEDCPANDLHVAIQTPAYFLMGYAEIFASVTGLEYAYTKAPANMKAFIMGLFLLTNAFGSALGIALSSVSVNPKLVWLYTGLACASVVAGICFWFLFRSFNDVEEELNVIDADYAAELNEQLKKENEEHLKHSKV